jgi:hypothetical protein
MLCAITPEIGPPSWEAPAATGGIKKINRVVEKPQFPGSFPLKILEFAATRQIPRDVWENRQVVEQLLSIGLF